MSLRDGNKKMSKSDESEYSRIDLKDSPEEIVKKIKKAKTDSAPFPENEDELNKRPEALNLVNIYSEITNLSVKKVLNDFRGKDFSKLKKNLSDAIVASICPIGDEIKKLMKDKGFLTSVLKKGKENANKKAEENLKKIREIIGLL